MEFKGTKGKWDLQNDRFIWGKVGSLLAEVNFTYSESENAFFSKPNDEYKANAKIIAAAPQMFEEIKETITDLKILRNQVESESKTNNLFDGMPELIQKWIDRKEQLLTKITEL